MAYLLNHLRKSYIAKNLLNCTQYFYWQPPCGVQSYCYCLCNKYTSISELSRNRCIVKYHCAAHTLNTIECNFAKLVSIIDQICQSPFALQLQLQGIWKPSNQVIVRAMELSNVPLEHAHLSIYVYGLQSSRHLDPSSMQIMKKGTQI